MYKKARYVPNLQENIDNMVTFYSCLTLNEMTERDIVYIEKTESFTLIYGVNAKKGLFHTLIWKPSDRVSIEDRNRAYSELKSQGIDILKIKQSLFGTMFNVTQATISSDMNNMS